MSTVDSVTECPYGCGWSWSGFDGLYERRLHEERAHAGEVRPPEPPPRCSFPDCDEDVDVEGFCFYHARHGAPEAPPLEQPGTAAVPNGTDPESEEELVPDQCKVEGCTRASAGKGGPWSRMCQHHITEEITRRQAKRYAKTAVKPPPAGGQRKGRKQPAKGPEPASAQASLGTSNGTLTSLAKAVEDWSAGLEQLERDVTAARVGLREAVLALGSALEEIDPFGVDSL